MNKFNFIFKVLFILTMMTSFNVKADQLECVSVLSEDSEMTKVHKRRECRLVKKKIEDTVDSPSKTSELQRINQVLHDSHMDLGHEIDLQTDENHKLSITNKKLISDNEKFMKAIDKDLTTLWDNTEILIQAQEAINELNSAVIMQHFEQIGEIKNDIEEKRKLINQNRQSIDKNNQQINENLESITGLLSEENESRKEQGENLKQTISQRYEQLKSQIDSKLNQVCNAKCQCGPQE